MSMSCSDKLNFHRFLHLITLSLSEFGLTVETKIREGYHYRPHSLAKQGDNVLGSVRPSVCRSVCPSVGFAECSKEQQPPLPV